MKFLLERYIWPILPLLSDNNGSSFLENVENDDVVMQPNASAPVLPFDDVPVCSEMNPERPCSPALAVEIETEPDEVSWLCPVAIRMLPP